MTFRVGSAQLWPSRFAVGQPQWPGLGVPFEDIPTSGANGGSPVADDGIAAGHEYRIETIETPSAGTLTIYPDLTASFVGAPDGSYTWRYTLYEDGASQGIGIVTFAVGAVNVNLAAAGVTVSTGAGALAVGVSASAVGVVVADGAAGLTATVTISAAGLAEAAGVAGLSVSSGGELLANGVAVASGSAALVVSINLQATGSAESGGSAALVGGAAEVTLTGAGYAQALAAGALTVAVDLVAAGAGVAGGSAGLAVAGVRILSVRPFGGRRMANVSTGRRPWQH